MTEKEKNAGKQITITSYETWATANDQKCRRMIGWETPVTAGKMSRQLFRITDRASLLKDSGFRLAGGAYRCKERRTPRAAVTHFLEEWIGDISAAVYYCDSIDRGEVLVWIK